MPRSIRPASTRACWTASLAAGATVIPHCAATAIQREARRLSRRASRGGTIAARNVVVATNGYTGALTPWLRRRVIPIGSYIIATEPIPR